MLFLADESCDAAVVRALRGAGHDVKAISEVLRGAADQAILDLAAAERRVLITKDKDFGELVFTGSMWAPVILLRFPPAVRSRLPGIIVEIASTRQKDLVQSFTVVTPAGARVSRLPSKKM